VAIAACRHRQEPHNEQTYCFLKKQDVVVKTTTTVSGFAIAAWELLHSKWLKDHEEIAELVRRYEKGLYSLDTGCDAVNKKRARLDKSFYGSRLSNGYRL
jgi:hypothetical protein